MTEQSLSSLYSVSLNFYNYFILTFTALSLLIFGVAICAGFDTWFFGGENSSEDSNSSKKEIKCLPSKKKSRVKGQGHRHHPHKQQQQKNPARIRAGQVKELMAADLKALATSAKEDPLYDPHNESVLLVDRDIYLTLKEGKTTSTLFTAKTTTTKLSASGHPLLDRHMPSNSSIKSKSKTNATKKTVTFKVKSKTSDSKKTIAVATAVDKRETVGKVGKSKSSL